MKKKIIYLTFFYIFFLIIEININFFNKKNVTLNKTNIINFNKVNEFSGIPKSQIIFCSNNNFEYKYISDRYGFNNSEKIYAQKYVDAMMIGDYLIHGDCVKNNENLYEVIKKNKIIANFAYASNGPRINLKTLKKFYFKISKPKYILWFFNENDDLFNLDQNHFNNRKFNNLKKDSNLKNNKFKKIFNVFKLSEIRSSTIGLILQNPSQIVYDKYEKILNDANQFSKNNGSNFIFIYFPSIYNFQSDNFFIFLRFKIIEKKVLSLLIKNNIKYINLKKVLKQNKKNREIFSNEKGHLTNIGYKLFANKIIQLIN